MKNRYISEEYYAFWKETEIETRNEYKELNKNYLLEFINWEKKNTDTYSLIKKRSFDNYKYLIDNIELIKELPLIEKIIQLSEHLPLACFFYKKETKEIAVDLGVGISFFNSLITYVEVQNKIDDINKNTPYFINFLFVFTSYEHYIFFYSLKELHVKFIYGNKIAADAETINVFDDSKKSLDKTARVIKNQSKINQENKSLLFSKKMYLNIESKIKEIDSLGMGYIKVTPYKILSRNIKSYLQYPHSILYTQVYMIHALINKEILGGSYLKTNLQAVLYDVFKLITVTSNYFMVEENYERKKEVIDKINIIKSDKAFAVRNFLSSTLFYNDFF